MKKSKKLLISSIVLISVGIFLIAFGIGWPFLKDNMMIQNSREFGTLRSDNTDNWMKIPGKHNISTS